MINSSYISWNKIGAVISLVASFLVYLATMADTVPYWDSGEFIASSYILGVPHPPGSPLYLLLGRIFSMLPFNSDIAFRVNLISPIVSALAVMFLYLSSFGIVKDMFDNGTWNISIFQIKLNCQALLLSKYLWCSKILY